MENKDYIEIFSGDGNKKMEVVLSFDSPMNNEYKYIIYKEFEEAKDLFAGKIKNGENNVLETVLSDEEMKLIEEVYNEAIKSI